MNIKSCNKYFCLCINYLNFYNKTHLVYYNLCYNNNLHNIKYKNVKDIQKNFKSINNKYNN